MNEHMKALELALNHYDDKRYCDTIVSHSDVAIPYHPYQLDSNTKRLPYKVFFNDKKHATTLIKDEPLPFSDDNVVVVKTTKGDKYNREYGFLMAYFQMYSGLSKTQANKYLKNLVKEK